MKILPIVMHPGHIPVVAFLGPLRIIFCVFLRPTIHTDLNGLLNLIFKWCGEYSQRLGFCTGMNFVLEVGIRTNSIVFMKMLIIFGGIFF